MTWIETKGEDEAEGDLKELYEDLQERRGKVSNIMRAQSLNPRAMRTHMDMYLAVMFGRSGLSRAERELVATLVSGANSCAYCEAHHGEALNRYWKDGARLRALLDKEDAGLSEREMAMSSFAVKLTSRPGSMVEEDLVPLRAAGMTDNDILDLSLIVGYFNFVNRIATGLGVEYTEEEKKGYKE